MLGCFCFSRYVMEIFFYTLSVMYSPGPVNFMGLNAGLTGQFKKTIYFFIGVGCAMLSITYLLKQKQPSIVTRKFRVLYVCDGSCTNVQDEFNLCHVARSLRTISAIFVSNINLFPESFILGRSS
jgi:hypothetical protein